MCWQVVVPSWFYLFRVMTTVSMCRGYCLPPGDPSDCLSKSLFRDLETPNKTLHNSHRPHSPK